MSDEPSRKRGRWGGGEDPPPIAPPPGMGFPTGAGAGAGGVPPPPPPPGATVANVPPPPPLGANPTPRAPGGAFVPSSDVPPGSAFGAPGAPAASQSAPSAVSADAARAAAQRAAAAIQATLAAAGHDAADPSRYPGMPPGWGSGMTEEQRAAAYHQHTRQSRRLYVGGIPKGTRDVDLIRFFNDAMLASGAAVDPAGGDPVVTANINHDKGFAFIEFRKIEDAESSLMFDGVVFEGSNVVVKRPKDYDPSRNPLVVMRGGVDAAGTSFGMVASGPAGASQSQLPIGEVAAADPSAPPIKLAMPPPIVSEWPRLPRRTPDGPNKLYLGGFDPLHVESQMRQVAAGVGELKSFAWMPDDKGKNTGHVFMEYKDPRLTDVAVEALTGVSLGGTTRRRLVCRRACPGATEPAAASDSATYQIPSDAIPMLETPSTTLWVYNAVTAEHDAVAAGEVEAAVRREAAAVAEWDPESVASRRAHPDGRVELTFGEGGGNWSGAGGDAVDAAVRCASGLNGRTFEGRPLWVRYVAGGKEEKAAEAGEGAVAVV